MADFNRGFSPTVSILRGQQVEEGLSQAELEGIALRDQMAARRAAAKMGEGNYFTGYEGVPGATRPDYLKQLYVEGDPNVAMQMEAQLNEPYRIARGVETAGRMEEAKKTADMRVMTNAMREFFPQAGGMNAMNTESAPAAVAPGGEAPSIPNVGEPGAMPAGGTMPTPGLSRLGDEERSVEMSMQGPKFVVKKMSPVEKALKISEDEDRKNKTRIAGDAERRQTIQAAHDNVRKIQDDIVAVQKAMQNRDMPWAEGRKQIGELNREMAEASAHRDALIRGKSVPASPAAGTPAPATPAPGPVSLAPAAPETEPRFTSKEQAGLDVKNRELKITAADKEIANARLGAEKVMKFKRQVGELYDLVTKQDIGHPTMEGIPGAANVLSLNRANAQVKKLAESIINMFAEPGQSQMMNTIVERQMQGAVVPNIFTDPQLNKINAAVLRSNVEHLQSFPTFLEKWQKNHNNTLDGAADAWIDYTDNNPKYGFKKDARGRVSVHENKKVMTPEAWTYLKSTGGVRKVGDKMFVKQADGSWVEK